MLRIGTAGWTIPRDEASRASGPGTHLERYARVLSAVEINSSFHRSHRLSTWQRWAASTPPEFRFSAKLPKAITHVAKLVIDPAALEPFAAEIAGLGNKLGVILVQLPPSLALDEACPAAEFFEALRDRLPHPIALEPRHPSWFTPDAEALLREHRIARVATDPPRHPRHPPASLPQPGGWRGLTYYRLHGSPRMYYSAYPAEYLEALARQIAEDPAAADSWVFLDNTAAGHAFGNALDLQALCHAGPDEPTAKSKGRSRSRTLAKR
ncbi:MAG: DUF72 domain-containing protein [Acidobacteriaceae bacterium]